MVSSDYELESEVRAFTGHREDLISSQEFKSVVQQAKRHIKTRRSLRDSEANWYTEPALEEALYWAVCLFSKVAVGELDSQTVQVGAIDHKTLLSKEDDDVTIWYRNFERALSKVNPESSFGVRSVGRREYGSDNEEDSSGGLSL